MRVRHFVCIDSESLELRRYENGRLTHECVWRPPAGRSAQLEGIESFRKFPPAELETNAA